MGTVKFLLKQPNSDRETQLHLWFNFDRKRLRFYTGVKLHPKQWSQKSQRVRKSYEGYAEINDYLARLSSRVQTIYTNIISSGQTPTIESIKSELEADFKKGNTREGKDFFQVFDEFIENQQTIRKQRTIKKYQTLKQHLSNYQRHERKKLNFENINQQFFERFRAYLINECGHFNNTLDKYIRTFKTFMGWATRFGYNQNMSYQDFQAGREEKEVIYLTENELDGKLYQLDLSNNKRLEKVRDVFYLACYTGLRFSDIAQLRKDHINGDRIILNTEKTNDRLKIPLIRQSKEILEKYDYSLPKISNQKINRYLKEIGEAAGIDEPMILTKYRGGEKFETNAPKCQLLSFHTARRTFITLSLERGMRIETVMAITGIKNYATLKKYLAITERMKDNEMKGVLEKGENVRSSN
jgi:integrase